MTTTAGFTFSYNSERLWALIEMLKNRRLIRVILLMVVI
jgi:hypothetical protein